MKKIKTFALLTLLCCSTIPCFSTNTDTLYVSPNPFDLITIIHFDIVQTDTISLNVFDKYGHSKKMFFQNTILPSGSYSINFQADSLPNGVYYVGLKINSTRTLSKKVLKTVLANNVNEYEKQKQLIYPNPTTGPLTIPYNGTKTIIITDLNGKVCKRSTITTNTLSLFDLDIGVYILTVLSDKERILTIQKIEKIK